MTNRRLNKELEENKMSKTYTVWTRIENKSDIVLTTNDLQEALNHVGNNELGIYSISKKTRYQGVYEQIL